MLILTNSFPALGFVLKRKRTKMHKYINLKTGQYPITEADIRAAHANISFPNPFQPTEDYALVFTSPPPNYSSDNQILIEVAPELTRKGHWEQRWEIHPKIKSENEQSPTSRDPK